MFRVKILFFLIQKGLRMAKSSKEKFSYTLEVTNDTIICKLNTHTLNEFSIEFAGIFCEDLRNTLYTMLVKNAGNNEESGGENGKSSSS